MHLHANRQNQGIRAVNGFNQQIWTDIGYVQSGVIPWSVYAPETEAATNPGFVGGAIKDRPRARTWRPTVGLKNAMVGGAGGSIELQPVSIEGNSGLNLAAGVATFARGH
jgi:hypothetical protein